MLVFTAALAVLFLVASSLAMSYPASVEFDFLSPQPNASYGSTSALPVVWAVQNAEAAALLNLKVELRLWKASNSSIPVGHRGYNTNVLDYSVGNTSFGAGYFDLKYVDDIEDAYYVDWFLSIATCWPYSPGDRILNGTVYFNIKKGAPDLEFASITQECANTLLRNQTFTLELNGTLDESPSNSDATPYPSTCQDVPRVDRHPSAEPCRVQINESLASTMSERIKSDYKQRSDASSPHPACNILVLALVGWVSFWFLGAASWGISRAQQIN